jgi:hypothetical protein
MNNSRRGRVSRLMRILAILLLPLAARAQEWAETPRPWESMDVDLREALKQGLIRSSDQIPDSPFGTHLWVMSSGHFTDRIGPILDQVAASGVKWIRDAVEVEVRTSETLEAAIARWRALPDHYATYCREAQARGLRILALLKVNGLPGGKATGAGEPGRRALAALCGIAVPALKAWIKDWEIDNEPRPCPIKGF